MIFIVLTVIFALLKISSIVLKKTLPFWLFATYIAFNGLCLSVSTFNPYDLYEVSDEVYLYQLLGIVMLTLGFLVPNNIGNSGIKQFRDFNIEKATIWKAFVVLSLLFVVYGLMKFNFLLATFSVGESRGIFFSDKSLLFGSKYLGYIWEWIISPLFYFVLGLLLYNIIVVKKRFVLPSLYVLFIILFGYVGGGRGHYVILILGYIVAKIIFEKLYFQSDHGTFQPTKSTAKIKNKIMLISSIAALLIIMGYMTSARSGNTDITSDNILDGVNQFFEQSVIYQVGPYRAFDYGLSNNYIDKIGQLYGSGTLAGVEEIVFTLFSLLGNTDFIKPSNEVITPVLQGNQILVGKGQGFNFAYTHLMIFYLDFKVWGIIAIPFLYGFFYRKAVNYFLVNTNIFSFVLILFLALSLLESNFKYGLQKMSQVLVVIGALFLSKVFTAVYRQKSRYTSSLP